MDTQSEPVSVPNEEEIRKKELNKRLESVSWGLFLVMLGGIWLVPGNVIPEGTWLIGAGLIMLGLNTARYYNHIPMSNGTIFLGVIALLVGFGDFLKLNLPVFPILLILIGLSFLVRVMFERK